MWKKIHSNERKKWKEKGESNSLPEKLKCGFGLFNEPGGRPLLRFKTGPDTGTGAEMENGTVAGADADIGIGDRGSEALPSDPYFLGLPLFFLAAVNGTPTRGGGVATAATPPLWLESSPLAAVEW